MRIPGLKLIKSLIRLVISIFYKIQQLFLFLISPIVIAIEKIQKFFQKWWLFIKSKTIDRIVFRINLKKRYKEISIKNAEESIQKCIEGAGGLKNIFKVKATLNTLKIWVYFKDFIDYEKINQCSAANIHISGNLIEVIAGFDEAQRICKSLEFSIKNSKKPLNTLLEQKSKSEEQKDKKV